MSEVPPSEPSAPSEAPPSEPSAPSEAGPGSLGARTRESGTFRSLAIRNYRLYFTGNVISQVGTWMNRVAQDWLVLQLTHNNAVALGFATALQFGPILGLSLWAGSLADRYDKRKLLTWVQVVLGSSGVILGMLATTHVAQIWHVYLICVIAGTAAALDGPIRQAFVMELVGPKEVPNAVALNAMGFNGARIVGPAVAGVLIALVDTGPVMIIAGLGYIGVIVGLALIRPGELHRTGARPSRRGQVREGLAYVRRRTDLILVLALLFMVSTFGMNFQLTLAIMARIVFHRDASSYGLLTTALAVGSLLGALLSARRRDRPRQRLLIVSAFAFGVVELVLGLTSSYTLLAALLVPQGVLMLVFSNAANATVQLGTDPDMRGRVMGLYTLVFLGGAPFMSPVLGVLADRYGGGAPLILGGVVSALSAVVLGAWIMRAHHVRLRLRRTPVPHVHVSNPLAPDTEGVSELIAASVTQFGDVARRGARPAGRMLRAHRTAPRRRVVRRPKAGR